MIRLLLDRVICLGMCCVIGGVVTAGEAEDLFERTIRPYLVERCYSCHATNGTRENGLAVDWAGGLEEGGFYGPAVVPGEPEQSAIMLALRHEEDLPMPKGGPKPTAAIVNAFDRWIQLGAPDPRQMPPSPEQLAEATSWETTFQRRLKWWSLQALADPAVPAPSKHSGWLASSDHPVDRFLFSRMAEAGVTPTGEADPDTLLRRATLVLTGLPPTLEQRQAFLKDKRPDRWSRLIDRLVDSPAFAERWARHWLDCVRYCETHGSEGNPAIPHAWQFRDWCVRAIDSDLPIDQFFREQIAGDLLPNPRIDRERQINESALGIGQLRMVPHGFNPTDPLDEMVTFTDNQIDVLSKAFLGMTVSCARCHNHKFDAISQADFYALFGVLESCRPAVIQADIPGRDASKREQLAELKQRIKAELAAGWQAATADLSARFDRALATDQTEADELERLEASPPKAAKNTTDRKKLAERKKKWEADCNRLRDRRRARRDPGHPLAVIFRLADAAAPDQQAVWRSLQQETAATGSTAPVDRGGLPPPKTWYASGNGLAGATPDGAFRVEPEGARVLTGLLPAGIHSNLLVSSAGGVLHSPQFAIDGRPIRMLVAGAGGARGRIVIWNYPRALGLNYFRTSLNDGQFQWITLQNSYFTGEEAHLELATGEDIPVETVTGKRSWFSLLAVDRGDGTLPPPVPPAGLFTLLPADDPLLSVATVDRAALAAGYAGVAQRAVEAWQREQATAADVRLINAFLEADLLPARMDELPAVARLVSQYRTIDRSIAPPVRAPGVHEGTVDDQPLFVRGDHRQPADRVPRRFLESIDPTPFPAENSGRLQLAEAIVAADNPLTPRVFVNRVWHHLFGRGVVASVDTFGAMGEQPSHPDLLDYLARRFQEESWSLKKLVRQLATSRAFRLAAPPTAAAAEFDPTNRLVSHWQLRRLEGEAIRDSLLMVAGLLDPKQFGPSASDKTNRRSIYLPVLRNVEEPFLSVFDPPSTQSTQGRRDSSQVPAQALVLLNGDLARRCSEALARSLLADPELSGAEARVRQLFLRSLSRPPTAEELVASIAWLDGEAARRGVDPSATAAAIPLWQDLAHAVLNLEEFIHVN
jgi:hypothetical protein